MIAWLNCVGWVQEADNAWQREIQQHRPPLEQDEHSKCAQCFDGTDAVIAILARKQDTWSPQLWRPGIMLRQKAEGRWGMCW